MVHIRKKTFVDRTVSPGGTMRKLKVCTIVQNTQERMQVGSKSADHLALSAAHFAAVMRAAAVGTGDKRQQSILWVRKGPGSATSATSPGGERVKTTNAKKPP